MYDKRTLSFLRTLMPFNFSIWLYDIHSSTRLSPTVSCKTTASGVQYTRVKHYIVSSLVTHMPMPMNELTYWQRSLLLCHNGSTCVWQTVGRTEGQNCDITGSRMLKATKMLCKLTKPVKLLMLLRPSDRIRRFSGKSNKKCRLTIKLHAHLPMLLLSLLKISNFLVLM